MIIAHDLKHSQAHLTSQQYFSDFVFFIFDARLTLNNQRFAYVVQQKNGNKTSGKHKDECCRNQ